MSVNIPPMPSDSCVGSQSSQISFSQARISIGLCCKRSLRPPQVISSLSTFHTYPFTKSHTHTSCVLNNRNRNMRYIGFLTKPMMTYNPITATDEFEFDVFDVRQRQRGYISAELSSLRRRHRQASEREKERWMTDVTKEPNGGIHLHPIVSHDPS